MDPNFRSVFSMVMNEIKAGSMSKFEINIDHDLCWGCKTCEVACKQENRAPDGVKLISVDRGWPPAGW